MANKLWKDFYLKNMYYDNKGRSFSAKRMLKFLKNVLGWTRKRHLNVHFLWVCEMYKLVSILLSMILPLKFLIRQMWSLFFAYSGMCIAGLFLIDKIRNNLSISHIYLKWIASYINLIQCVTLNRREFNLVYFIREQRLHHDVERCSWHIWERSLF